MRGATSFDAKGARYTHRDGLCLSEVLIEDYKLDDVNTATQDATSAPIPSCCRTATPSLPMLSARFSIDEMLCEAEAGLSRPPVELCSTLGVRQLCAHPGWGRARCR